MAGNIDLSWHTPILSNINNLTSAINGTGTYGFIFDSSTLPEGLPYGTYNFCNMPHVGATGYPKVDDSSYTLSYVEVIHRHHKRTPYASNTFPVETYPWKCDDEGLFTYGSPLPSADNANVNQSANTYWQVYSSPANPLVAKGFPGTCRFPQITKEGLDDSWQHGHDIYQVYHTLLSFLPEKYDPQIMSFRVTNNVITSQVASMVVSGMFGSQVANQNFPLLIQPSTVDSLEPGYTCPSARKLWSTYGVGGKDPAWTAHLNAASALFAQLDAISGVPRDDSGWHESVDHYFDNLSARLCHDKPLPCKAADSSRCVTRDMADTVFRLGEYEYSYLYRDGGEKTLQYAVGAYGIWIGELAANLRAAISQDGKGVKYRHNVAHDGSVSLVLGILQVEQMVWPGMGSEVVFELYWKEKEGGRKYYIRVLWGGQVLKSSHPSLGSMDMLEVETLLAYFDGLVGEGGKKVPGLCGL
ncbi:Histidine phosphatase superfamily [Naviculisporaceae sp. PSN 640]